MSGSRRSCAKTTFDEIENLGTVSRLVSNPTLSICLDVGACRQGVGRSKRRIKCDRLKAVVPHGLNSVTRKCIGQRQCAQIVVVGAQVLGSLSPRAFDFSKLDRGFQNAHDRLGDPVLQVEQVFRFSVVFFAPHMVAGGRIDELRSEADAAADAPDAAFQHVPYPKLAPDLAHIHGTTFVCEA